MIHRFLIACYRATFLFGLLAAMALGFGPSAAEAKELSPKPFTDLYVFGDSLSDSGNPFFAEPCLVGPARRHRPARR